MKKSKYDGIVILGPTASGKTNLAVSLANVINGEIISADSRQVYKNLDIGTGKDLAEYEQFESPIKHHIINIISPKEQFYLKDYIPLVYSTFDNILEQNCVPIVCGGTGQYLDVFHKTMNDVFIPENLTLRDELKNKELIDLITILDAQQNQIKKLIDISTKKRIIRGIEKCLYLDNHEFITNYTFNHNLIYFGLNPTISVRRSRIDKRLKQRLDFGLIEEVELLIASKEISVERLEKLGLEYLFVAQYLQNKLTKIELYEKLRVAIHRYAKRQMTWFRKMEKEGVQIHWLPENSTVEEQIQVISKLYLEDV
jgi:tRNA dimethylallyltransferase